MRRILIPAALLVATLSLAGCSAAAGSSSSYDTSPGGQKSGASAPNAVTEVSSGSGALDSSAKVDRSVITTGTVTVTVDAPADAARKATTLVEAIGGRVDARDETAPVQGDNGSATLTLRIPATQLTSTLEKLKALGKVEQVSISATDVTAQVQDTDARIKALQASVDRLTALLATAKDTAVLITIEGALTERQANLESMEAQQRSLADQTSMSTITLSLISKANAPVHKPDTFLTGLQAGWDSFVGFLAGLLVAVGVFLPWLIFFGIITVVIIFIIRRSNRKKRAAATSVGTPAKTVETSPSKKG